METDDKGQGIERNQNPIPAKICGWRSLVKTRSVAGGPRAAALKQQALSFGSLVLYFDAAVRSCGPDGRHFSDPSELERAEKQPNTKANSSKFWL